MSTSHRRRLASISPEEIRGHIAAAFDDEDSELLSAVAQAYADQIRTLDRMVMQAEPDLRGRADRLDYLARLLSVTNRGRPRVVADWKCAYCGDPGDDEPMWLLGRKYHEECAAVA